MELTWWAVAIAGVVALILVVALAVLLPTERPRGRRPLANTARLTRLPEYRAVVRRQTRTLATVLALSTLLFGVTVLASARPSGTLSDATESGPRDDIMLCVGQPVTDPATGEFLGYFAAQTTTFGTERIGLTSSNRRVVPLTRDYQFAAGRFGDYSQAARAQAEADAGTLPPTGTVSLRARTESFAAPVAYDDYSPTVADVLALCLTGFPGFESSGDTRRSLIYLGPGALRSPDDNRPSLFTDAQVTEMALQAGVEVNAVATPGRETDALAAVTGATGGQFFRFASAALGGDLDTIRAAPAADRDGGGRGDSPVLVLVAALAVAALLSVSLMAVRR